MSVPLLRLEWRLPVKRNVRLHFLESGGVQEEETRRYDEAKKMRPS